jgi:hypothetical protein
MDEKDMTLPENNNLIPGSPDESKSTIEIKLQKSNDFKIGENLSLQKRADGNWALMAATGIDITGLELEDLKALEAFFKEE